MKQLIICPNCESRGIKQNMAEVTPKGYVSIQRMRHRSQGIDYIDHTIVSGSNFSLICGLCGTVCFIKETHEVGHNL